MEGYQKIELLGKGGFALVWLAKDLNNDRKVAVKQINKTTGGDSFKREMRVFKAIQDPSGDSNKYKYKEEEDGLMYLS